MGASSPRKRWRTVRWQWSVSCRRPKDFWRRGFRWSTDAALWRWRRRRFTESWTKRFRWPASRGRTAKPPPVFWSIRSCAPRAGRRCWRAPSNIRLGSKVLPAPNTTPESLDLHRMLAELDAIGRCSQGGDHGSFLARAGAGTRLRDAVSHRCLHESDAGSSRLPQHDGRLFRGEAAAVHGRTERPPPRYAVINRDDARSRRIAIGPEHGSALVRPGKRSDGTRAAYPLGAEWTATSTSITTGTGLKCVRR